MPWMMKCPRCGSTVYRDQPWRDARCEKCGWLWKGTNDDDTRYVGLLVHYRPTGSSPRRPLVVALVAFAFCALLIYSTWFTR